MNKVTTPFLFVNPKSYLWGGGEPGAGKSL